MKLTKHLIVRGPNKDTHPNNLPSSEDTYLLGKLSGLIYLRRNNQLYCWYPGSAKRWNLSSNNTLATFVAEDISYWDAKAAYPDAFTTQLPPC